MTTPRKTASRKALARVVDMPVKKAATRPRRTAAEKAVANWDANVPQFVEALVKLAQELAEWQQRANAAEAKIVEIADNAALKDELAGLRADWTELNQLLNYYAKERGWCSDYDSVIRSWNTRFTSGLKLLVRPDRGRTRDVLPVPDGWRPPSRQY